MHALVTSGGAAHGAYQIGWASMAASADIQYEPDLYVGTSVGGLFAAMVAMHKTFRVGVRDYQRLWMDHVNKTEDIYKTWWPSWMGQLAYLPGLWKGSLFDARPLQELIRDNFDLAALRSSGKKLILTSTNLENGALTYWMSGCDGSAPMAYIRDWKPIYATAAYPLGFQMIDLVEGLHTDGGVREITPLSAAIRAGATRIDVLMCQPVRRPRWEEKTGVLNLLSRGLRVLELMTDEIVTNDIKRCAQINDDVKAGRDRTHRYIDLRIFRPEQPLHGSGLDFNKETWMENWARGVQDGFDAFNSSDV